MRVLLRASALRSAENGARLPALLYFAVEGEHDILLDLKDDPEAKAAWEGWLRTVGAHGPVYQRAIDDSNERQATRFSDREIIVEEPSDERGDWPSCSLADAISFLRRPLEIGIEDETSDGCFLESVVPPPLRAHWRALTKRGLLRWWNLGGVTNAPRHLRTRAKRDSRSLERVFVLIDSDAKEPWKTKDDLPKDNQKVVKMATHFPITLHVLRRRMIENYVPPEALKRWSDAQPGTDRREKQEHADVFAKLSPARRQHHNLKEGMVAGEEKYYAAEGIEAAALQALRKRLGSKVYEALKLATDDEFHRDRVYAEMSEVFQTIFRLA